MDRTSIVIKYLEEYKHHCYVRGNRATNKAEAEYYRSKYKDIDKLIKELEEHGCRRTIDGK
jgi:hypothetical protein